MSNEEGAEEFSLTSPYHIVRRGYGRSEDVGGTSTTNKHSGIGRRKFLGLAAGTAAALIVGHNEAVSKSGLPEPETPTNTEILERSRKVQEIQKYREALGFSGLPRELMQALEQPKKEWASAPASMEIRLPEYIKSYGMRVAEVMGNIFGDNARKILHGVTIDQGAPFGMSFNPGSREFNVPQNVYGLPIHPNFLDYIFHEGVGHGSDPAFAWNVYPKDTLIDVVHGKWRMLSQAFSIENQFFNHPGDLMYPLLKKQIGEEMAIKFLTSSLSEALEDGDSISFVQNLIEATAEEERASGRNIKSAQDLKFNKRICKRLGEGFMANLRDGRVRLKGKTKEDYEGKVGGALVEMYAEMLRYGFLHPNEIRDNPEIRAGCKEIACAVSGRDFDLDQLKEQVKVPGQEVLVRNKDEKTVIDSIDKGEPLPNTKTMKPEEIEAAKKQEEEYKRREKVFQLFMKNGTLPDNQVTDHDQLALLQDFGNACWKIAGVYPPLKNTFAVHLNESFDPDMHAWEIRRIESAMNSGFIRDLLVKLEKAEPLDFNHITEKVTILHEFMGSPAYRDDLNHLKGN